MLWSCSKTRSLIRESDLLIFLLSSDVLFSSGIKSECFLMMSFLHVLLRFQTYRIRFFFKLIELYVCVNVLPVFIVGLYCRLILEPDITIVSSSNIFSHILLSINIRFFVRTVPECIDYLNC